MFPEELYRKYVRILNEELIPAMGCTEPIAIAYAAAKAKAVLGEEPVSATLALSGNIVKNAKSVTVPHTGGMRGIKAAFAVGVVAGKADAELEVISDVTEAQIPAVAKFADTFPLKTDIAQDAHIFDIAVTLQGKKHTAFVHIVDTHTNIVRIERDKEVLLAKEEVRESYKEDRNCLTVENIIAFADNVKIDDIREVISRQISYNMAIAEEGLKNDYGANIGKVLLRSFQPDIKTTAKAYAAAGSDARMNGCELPVVINSGSGNQGITASVPVIVYARGMNLPEETLYRALCVSNLIAIHLKSGIGTLSAYCGVVSAGAGAGCGVAYLLGGRFKEISHCLVNALAIDSGIICDGAKASCAAKIATAVESGLLGLNMYYEGNQFYAGDGIVKKGVENTIRSVSRLARDGMGETDKEILRIMLET
jgi:L-cysteine desulfidase